MTKKPLTLGNSLEDREALGQAPHCGANVCNRMLADTKEPPVTFYHDAITQLRRMHVRNKVDNPFNAV